MRGKAAATAHHLKRLEEEAEALESFIHQIQERIKDTKGMTTSEIKFLKSDADKAEKKLNSVRRQIAKRR